MGCAEAWRALESALGTHLDVHEGFPDEDEIRSNLRVKEMKNRVGIF